MKLTSVLLAGVAMLGAASSANALIQVTNATLGGNGNSELFLVVQDTAVGAIPGTNSNYVLDLGVLLNNFNPNIAYSYNLAADPIYQEWLSKLAPSPNLTFAVAGAFGQGTVNSRIALATSSVGWTAPTSVTNNVLLNQTGALTGSWLAGVNGLSTAADRSAVSSHSTPNLVTQNGSSFQMATSGTTAFSAFFNNWISPLKVQMVNAGQAAEFYKLTAGASGGGQPVKVEDFFSATETATNLGGYWKLQNSLLTYTAAPITAPIPEPGEWAMMMAGLGLVGVMARRRSKQAAR